MTLQTQTPGVEVVKNAGIEYRMSNWTLDAGEVRIYFPSEIRTHELEPLFECIDLWKRAIANIAKENDRRGNVEVPRG